MEIEFLILADAVEAVNGKLYMMGGAWDRYHSTTYPAPVQMGIAIGLLVDWDETNQKHDVRVSILDEDGRAAVPDVGGQVEVGRPPGITAGARQRSILAINASFPLQKPGRYVVKASAGFVEREVAFEALLARTRG